MGFQGDLEGANESRGRQEQTHMTEPELLGVAPCGSGRVVGISDPAVGER